MSTLSDQIEKDNEEYSNMSGSYSYVGNFIYTEAVKSFIEQVLEINSTAHSRHQKEVLIRKLAGAKLCTKI